MLKKKIYLYPLLFCLIFNFFISGVLAFKGGLSLQGKLVVNSGEYIYLNVDFTTKENINVVDGKVIFSSDNLIYEGYSNNNSSVNLWPNVPTQLNNKVTFSGAFLNPGIIGSANITTLKFKANKSGNVTFALDLTGYLNNGEGTKVKAQTVYRKYYLKDQVLKKKESSVVSEQPAESEKEGSSAKEEDGTFNFFLKSDSHPNQDDWSNNSLVKLDWAERKDLVYKYQFTQEENYDYNSAIETKDFSLEKELTDGEWNFFIQHYLNDQWSEVFKYKFKIDTEVPVLEKVNLKRLLNYNILDYRANDKLSGIKNYKIIENDLYESETNKNFYHLEVKDLEELKYLKLQIFDRAGNNFELTLPSLIFKKGINLLEGYVYGFLTGLGLVFAVFIIVLVLLLIIKKIKGQ